MNQQEKNQLLNTLDNSECIIKYKKENGEIVYRNSTRKGFPFSEKENTIQYFDIDKNEIRSFCKNNFIKIVKKEPIKKLVDINKLFEIFNNFNKSNGDLTRNYLVDFNKLDLLFLGKNKFNKLIYQINNRRKKLNKKIDDMKSFLNSLMTNHNNNIPIYHDDFKHCEWLFNKKLTVLLNEIKMKEEQLFQQLQNLIEEKKPSIIKDLKADIEKQEYILQQLKTKLNKLTNTVTIDIQKSNKEIDPLHVEEDVFTRKKSIINREIKENKFTNHFKDKTVIEEDDFSDVFN